MAQEPTDYTTLSDGDGGNITLQQSNPACLVICDPSGELVVKIDYDGSVEYGPAFTTHDAASKQFWEAMGRMFTQSTLARFDGPIARPSNE